MEEDKKKLEIVSGDGEDLEISPVYEHLNTVKPKFDSKPKNIIVPKSKEDDENDEEEDDDEKKDDKKDDSNNQQ